MIISSLVDRECDRGFSLGGTGRIEAIENLRKIR